MLLGAATVTITHCHQDDVVPETGVKALSANLGLIKFLKLPVPLVMMFADTHPNFYLLTVFKHPFRIGS